jgi:hypothetical protein
MATTGPVIADCLSLLPLLLVAEAAFSHAFSFVHDFASLEVEVRGGGARLLLR